MLCFKPSLTNLKDASITHQQSTLGNLTHVHERHHQTLNPVSSTVLGWPALLRWRMMFSTMSLSTIQP